MKPSKCLADATPTSKDPSAEPRELCGSYPSGDALARVPRRSHEVSSVVFKRSLEIPGGDPSACTNGEICGQSWMHGDGTGAVINAAVPVAELALDVGALRKGLPIVALRQLDKQVEIS
eukprot:NODE_6389_length_576_cov_19.286528_g5976_i0.p2 GENE.NODE_6389_length_576_cov_19.286528_g5976_i0~~NODE_6389_length_576_cov_19.286528_g5976_i0.p2  ORF type:complete len:132 (-),score=27.29 NODE_6389_length_576_cov_19.286528_g5976_i0:180-536(-)